MFSSDLLKSYGATKIIGTGTALSRNTHLQRQVAQQYSVPFEMCSQHGDASYGAAIAARLSWTTVESEERNKRWIYFDFYVTNFF